MSQKDARTIHAELARPFAPEDLEWRLQKAEESGKWGIAVPYVTNRAIQARLDEVVGPENWYNDFKPWHGSGKKEAQICGISIYFEERGQFITKWDGAEDSDIERRAYDTIGAIFENTFQDYNEEWMMDIYVFCDPLIDRFCRLCWQYEQRGHLTEEENPYRKEAEQIIRSGFEFGGYNYNFDWRLSASDRGRRRLLFFHGPEFYCLEDLPEGLLEIRDGFQAVNFELETALSNLDKEDAMEKEAA